MKKTLRLISFFAALSISAVMLTGCGGSGSGGTSSGASTVMPWETQNSQTTSTIEQPSTEQPSVTQPSIAEPSVVQPSIAEPSVVQPSIAEPSVVQPSIAEPSVVQPSIVEPSVVQPSIVEPSVVQPSVVQPSTVTPTGQKSIKEALEADIGVAGVASTFQKQFGGDKLVVTGEYTNDDAIVFFMTLTTYIDPNAETTRNSIAALATQFEGFSSQMAQSISMLETQYNVRPFTMEFRVCNADGSVLYTRVFSDQG